MKYYQLIAGAVLACLILTLPGCVELEGQRITVHYDSKKDELHILICYDGIHDSDSRKSGKEQIPEFLKDGNIMILDWPFHIKKTNIRKEALRDNNPEAVRAFASAYLNSVKTRILGHYRDANGQIGAAQLVVISNAKEFIQKANAAISETILSDISNSIHRHYPSTMKRILAAAKKKHQWISIEGQSICGSIPIHIREWNKIKADGIEEFLNTSAWEKAKTDDKINPGIFLQLFSVTPITLNESRKKVSFRLGDPKRENTFRFRLRDDNEYKTNLEGVVVESVPAKLDEILCRHLIEADVTPVASIIDWMPAEGKVRAVLNRYIETKDKAALSWLIKMGQSWNRENSIPKAPTDPAKDPQEAYIEAWKTWYRNMLTFPKDAEKTKKFGKGASQK